MNTPDRNPNDQPQSDELLSAYLDNELSEADRAALKSQLEQDPALRESLAELETLSQMLHKLPQHSLPDRFAERVLRRAERQMLLGEGAPAPQASDTTAALAPSSPDTSKGALARKYWWIPAALAALLAGVLFVPSLIPRANVAQMDKANSALEPATKGTAAAEEVARSQQVEVADRQEAMARLEETMPPTARRVPAPEAPAPASVDRFRDLAMTDEVGSDADDTAMPPAAPTPALNFEPGLEKMEVEELAERAPTQRAAVAREGKADNLASTTWRYDQNSPLIEVELPLVAGQSASLDDVASPATPGESDQVAAGALLGDARGVADAGQLYRIQGPPEVLTKLIEQFKSQGSIIRNHELPPALQLEIAKWNLQRSGRDGKTSQMGVQLNELRANQPLRGWIDTPDLEIVVLEPSDSKALARLAEQHVGRAARKKQSPARLQQALLSDADNAQRAAEAANAPADGGRQAGARLERATVDDQSDKGEAAAPGRTQLYLWVHHPLPSAAETPSSEQPRGDERD